ncbi:hypothetical protein DFJ75_3667 [Williamsia muralis]|uniref:DUF3263 domain-containing protein n=1 Tax=Williamsia marianensis TaxID=85044 RepID=A0A495K8V4_WILMA|nr:hypothetical protein [Williamsia muralis]RKR96812.1 hypothetical protein DFJ75_3667 [Williamsia muralis]
MTSRIAPADHARLLEFAERWYPFGGGSAEDIFVEFGLTVDAYFERLSDALGAGLGGLAPEVHEALQRICNQRLHSA